MSKLDLGPLIVNRNEVKKELSCTSVPSYDHVVHRYNFI